MFKELLRGLKYVIIALSFVAVISGLFIGTSWSLGWFAQRFYDLKNFSSSNYISFGSSILAFTFIVQIVTIVFTVWGLLSWGKSRGIYGKKESKK